MVKETIALKEVSIQIRAIRKVQKGGVVVESETRQEDQKMVEYSSESRQIVERDTEEDLAASL